jgi:hypothetical protein
MVIDYERDERTPQEIKEGKLAPKRRLPIGDIAKVADAVKVGDGIERGAEAVEGEEVPSVLHAARDGFIGGFAGGLGQNASTIGQLKEIAETLEEGVVGEAESVEDRLRRFPELQGVEVPTGNAAKYPELAEQPQVTAPAAEAEGALTR